jgi:hypothetical protein
MPTQSLTRAWTDLDFRASLTAADLELLDHPSGDLDAELNQLVATNDCSYTPTTTGCTIWTNVRVHFCCC